MRKLKKNNKGFSLVELIVVILIMAILSVALAPQVMKWVNNSRISADYSTYNTLVSSIELALADETTYTTVSTATITVTMSGSNLTVASTPTAAATALDTQLTTVIGANYKTTTKAKVSGGSYVITVTNGVVAKTTPPAGTLS
jgi:type IV pilus assembly protein PilA